MIKALRYIRKTIIINPENYNIMKKNIHIEYTEDIKEIRAIALNYKSNELTIKSLSKAMLILKNGRKAISNYLKCEEYLLEIIDMPFEKIHIDNPGLKWPEELFEKEDDDLSDLDDLLDDEKEKRKPLFVDINFLSEKLIENISKEYFFKKEIAKDSEEFINIINHTKDFFKKNATINLDNINNLLDLIEIQYLRNFQQNIPSKPSPIFIFSSGDNNEFEILNMIQKFFKCRSEIFKLEIDSSSNFPEILSEYPPALAVFHHSEFISENSNLEALLTYYETGIEAKLGDETRMDFSNSLFNIDEKSEIKPIKQILMNNIVVFLIKIPDEIKNYNKITCEELSFIIQNYYREKYENSIKDSYYNIRLLGLAQNYNSIILNKLEYSDILGIIKNQINVSGYNVSKVSKRNFLIISNLIILLSGKYRESLIRSATDYLLCKTRLNKNQLNEIYFEINCNIEQISEILTVKELDENKQIRNFERIFDKLITDEKKASFKILSSLESKKIIISDFTIYSTILNGSKSYFHDRPDIRFSDVIGLEEVKKRFRTIINYYSNPELFIKLETIPNNRILLSGAPGTGKTYITKAFAGEMGIPFFYLSASEITSQKYAGFGGSLLRELFRTAKAYKPCILFFDELDAFGNRDNIGNDSVGFDAKSIINTLLVELDGIDSENDIIVIGATNRSQDIDTALIRPKRFGSIIETGGFSIKDRESLIKLKLKPQMCLGSYDNIIKNLISRTNEDFSPALIEDIVNEAKLTALNNKNSKVKLEDFNEVIDNLVLGRKIEKVNILFKKTMAYHQAGHALLYKIFFQEKKIDKISISIRENANGFMQLKENEKIVNQLTSNELIDTIIIILGGAISEKIKFGSWGLNAEDDWEFVSILGAKIAGNIDLGVGLKSIVEYQLSSDGITENVKNLTEKIINLSYQKAEELISENWIDLELLAQKLIMEEEISGNSIDRILKSVHPNKQNLLEVFKQTLSNNYKTINT